MGALTARPCGASLWSLITLAYQSWPDNLRAMDCSDFAFACCNLLTEFGSCLQGRLASTSDKTLASSSLALQIATKVWNYSKSVTRNVNICRLLVLPEEAQVTYRSSHFWWPTVPRIVQNAGENPWVAYLVLTYIPWVILWEEGEAEKKEP